MKEWIVYFYGTEPYEISMCTRSLPVGLGGSDDIAELDRIVAHRR